MQIKNIKNRAMKIISSTIRQLGCLNEWKVADSGPISTGRDSRHDGGRVASLHIYSQALD